MTFQASKKQDDEINLKNISIRSLLALMVVFLAACQKDDVDHPPYNELDSAKIITIQQLRAMYSGQPVRF
jgi:hypothetical protein